MKMNWELLLPKSGQSLGRHARGTIGIGVRGVATDAAAVDGVETGVEDMHACLIVPAHSHWTRAIIQATRAAAEDPSLRRYDETLADDVHTHDE